MKIGILTFHRALNYGAVLQCYALYEFLREEGYDVEIIDYRICSIEKEHRLFLFDKRYSLRENIKIFISRIIKYYDRKKCRKNFDQFIFDSLNISIDSYRKSSEIPAIYDIYILGSDQIWNPRILDGFDDVFLGRFPMKQKSKIIAYAASMGNEHDLKDESLQYLGNSIASFNSVSVREKSLADFLFPILNVQLPVVLDPTLLVDRDVFDKIAIKPNVSTKYVLLFLLGKDTEAISFANNIANQINAKVIRISAFQSIYMKRKNDYSALSPNEFCGWFKYADCIVSLSFHGTAFSLLFRKDFYCLENKLQDRTENLLSLLGLNSRLVSSSSNLTFTTVNYTNVDKKLDKLRELSKDFLIRAINEK
jgi:hypothetical protein